LIQKLLDALHAELVGISFSYEGKEFYVPERESVEQSLAESLFFENEKLRKVDKIEI
jgi:hypothetical protein